METGGQKLESNTPGLIYATGREVDQVDIDGKAIPLIVQNLELLGSKQLILIVRSHGLSGRPSIEAERPRQSRCMRSDCFQSHAKPVLEDPDLPLQRVDIVLQHVDLVVGRCCRMDQVWHPDEG